MIHTAPVRPDAAEAIAPISYCEDLRLDQQLCFAMYSTNNKLARIYGSVLERFGLTLPQSLALMVLWEKSPRTVGEVAQALELESGSITPLLKRLEGNGYVSRIRDCIDERRVHIHLTEKGRDLQGPIIELRKEFVSALAVSDESLSALRVEISQFSKVLSRAEPWAERPEIGLAALPASR